MLSPVKGHHHSKRGPHKEGVSATGGSTAGCSWEGSITCAWARQPPGYAVGLAEYG